MLSQIAKTELETKLTNKIEVSDVVRVIDGAVNMQCELGWMTTVMLHLYMHPTK